MARAKKTYGFESKKLKFGALWAELKAGERHQDTGHATRIRKAGSVRVPGVPPGRFASWIPSNWARTPRILSSNRSPPHPDASCRGFSFLSSARAPTFSFSFSLSPPLLLSFPPNQSPPHCPLCLAAVQPDRFRFNRATRSLIDTDPTDLVRKACRFSIRESVKLSNRDRRSNRGWANSVMKGRLDYRWNLWNF